MLNVIIPMSGRMPFFEGADFPFPKPLVEINGMTMIEYVVNNIQSLGSGVRAFFMVRNDFCKKYYLDQTIHLLAPEHATVIPVALETQGALCTAMLAIDQIDPMDPLIILNSDQFFACDFENLVAGLFEEPYEGGCLVFPSVHPRWSYVRTEHEVIVEAAEKRPITRQAVAGVYGFKRSGDFFDAARSALMKDAAHEQVFYISAAINELVLMGRRLRAVAVPPGKYHSFYSPKKIEEFSIISKSIA